MAGNTDGSGPPPVKRKQRGPGRKWQPGESGNPSGRPKICEEVRQMLKAHTPKAVERLVQALDATRWVGGSGDRDPIQVDDYDMRVKAASIILDRVAGKPAPEVVDETAADRIVQVIIPQYRAPEEPPSE